MRISDWSSDVCSSDLGASVALVGTVTLVVAILHDVALLRAGAPASALHGMGLLVFVFAHATVLGGRPNAAFAAAESLSRDLRQLNLTLERKVADRKSTRLNSSH